MSPYHSSDFADQSRRCFQTGISGRARKAKTLAFIPPLHNGGMGTCICTGSSCLVLCFQSPYTAVHYNDVLEGNSRLPPPAYTVSWVFL